MNTREYLLSEPAVICALGADPDTVADNLSTGRSPGMRRLELAGGDATWFGYCDLAATSAPTRVDALLDALLPRFRRELQKVLATTAPERIGVVLGTSNATMEEFTDHPTRCDMAYPAHRLRSKLNLGGPAWCVSTACSSGCKVFASARALLARGLCDAVVTGGVDARTRTVIEGFHALETLAAGRTRPLAADRDGINLGEGAALFVLRRGEDVADADRPGTVRLLGVGESSDACHLTAPDPEGRGAEAAMRAALADARLSPADVDYINLHGTGTVYNDAMECAAIRRVFGARVSVSSTKPLTGHCLGAAGAIEAALCHLTLTRRRGLPPHAVDAVDRTLAPFPIPTVETSGAQDVRQADILLSNAFAFGGSNAAILLGRQDLAAKDCRG